MSYRFYFLGALVFVLALAAAGSAGGGAARPHANYAVSGTVSIISEATGTEAKHFENVLADFKKLYPKVKTKYTSGARNLPTLLATSVAGGNPPDMALLPQPSLLRSLVAKKAPKPIEFLRSTVKKDWSSGWVALGSVKGKLYGLYLKGANKSTVWYNVHAFKNAGVSPPKTFTKLLSIAKTLKSSGTDAYSIGGSDGWSLTDMFENIYLRQAGGKKYDQLSAHKIKWTDPSVKAALRTMAKIVGDTNNIPGGRSGALQTTFSDSVNQALTTGTAKGAMVFEGDFVAGTVTTKAKPGVDFNFFNWPQIGKSPPSVVAGGDAVVMFRDKPATRALMTYFASRRAGEVYAKQGGFSSPNKLVRPSAYPDAIVRRSALALARSKISRFDLSDLQPPAFGATNGQGEFKLFQDFVKDPSDVNGIASKLESAAAAAYKK